MNNYTELIKSAPLNIEKNCKMEKEQFEQLMKILKDINQQLINLGDINTNTRELYQLIDAMTSGGFAPIKVEIE